MAQDQQAPTIPTLQPYPVFDRGTAAQQFFSMQNSRRNDLLGIETEYANNPGSFSADDLSFLDKEFRQWMGRPFGSAANGNMSVDASASTEDKLKMFGLSLANSALLGLPRLAAGLISPEDNWFRTMERKDGMGTAKFLGDALGFITPWGLTRAATGLGTKLIANAAERGAVQKLLTTAAVEGTTGGIIGAEIGAYDPRAVEGQELSLGGAFSGGGSGFVGGALLGTGFRAVGDKLSAMKEARAYLSAEGATRPGATDASARFLAAERVARAKLSTNPKELGGKIGVPTNNTYNENSTSYITRFLKPIDDIGDDGIRAFNELAKNSATRHNTDLVMYNRLAADLQMADEKLAQMVDYMGGLVDTSTKGRMAVAQGQAARREIVSRLNAQGLKMQRLLNDDLANFGEKISNDEAKSFLSALTKRVDGGIPGVVPSTDGSVSIDNEGAVLSSVKRVMSAFRSRDIESLNASLANVDEEGLRRLASHIAAPLTEGGEASLPLAVRSDLGSTYWNMRSELFSKVPKAGAFTRHVEESKVLSNDLVESGQELVNNFLNHFEGNENSRKMAGKIYELMMEAKDDDTMRAIINGVREQIDDVRLIGDLRLGVKAGKKLPKGVRTIDSVLNKVRSSIRTPETAATAEASPAARAASANGTAVTAEEPTVGTGTKFEFNKLPEDMTYPERVKYESDLLRLTNTTASEEELTAMAEKKLLDLGISPGSTGSPSTPPFSAGEKVGVRITNVSELAKKGTKGTAKFSVGDTEDFHTGLVGTETGNGTISVMPKTSSTFRGDSVTIESQSHVFEPVGDYSGGGTFNLEVIEPAIMRRLADGSIEMVKRGKLKIGSKVT